MPSLNIEHEVDRSNPDINMKISELTTFQHLLYILVGLFKNYCPLLIFIPLWSHYKGRVQKKLKKL